MPHPWQDTELSAAERAADLLARMTLEEKVGQLSAIWPGSDAGGEDVAPLQHQFTGNDGPPGSAPGPASPDTLPPHGPGQLTRPFGTLPVEPLEGARALADLQRRVMANNRFGIPAQAHDECLTGFTAWQASILPTPLAWGATFDPELLERAAAMIGESMRAVGIHQGLSPVLDVVRDPRWGRTEESIGEDPQLVAELATAYVRGLESSGVVATLKHFAGYSASRAGRNHAPVSMGPREMADVILPPFELALREGGARSVMHAYTDTDGVPSAGDPELLTELLRERWGFTGTVVADYFGISFLELSHRVADGPGTAAVLALEAGVDVELPVLRCYGEPLVDAVRSGAVSEELVDRAVLRVLIQKCELGLLDPDWDPTAPALRPGAPATLVTPDGPGDGSPDGPGPRIDLDPPALRDVARRLAEESVILLANDGTLPLRPGLRIGVTGPFADESAAMLGCYTFPRHVGVEHPELPLGVELPSLLESLRAELPQATIDHHPDPGTAAALSLPMADGARPDVWVVALGDRSGLFGRGTSGEGCDAADLELPENQGALLDALVDTGVPVVAVLLTGRPYALGRWADRLAGIVQAFFPGEEGGPAVAGVLSGRVNPSGRLPVGVPRHTGGQPGTYLAPPLGRHNDASSLDPGALFPFGHGLTYTSFAWEDPAIDTPTLPTDGRGADGAGEAVARVSVTVRNTGDRAGTEIVQLYLHDPVARIVRPVQRLIGWARVTLEPGASARVTLDVHPDLASYTLRPGRRIVEPGALELRLAASSEDVRHSLALQLTGEEHTTGPNRRMTCPTLVEPLPAVPTDPGAVPAAAEPTTEEVSAPAG
ncbi:glycoside hydrolase family 3 N-terminal domain-containing protein [Streptomyces calidiresistens]